MCGVSLWSYDMAYIYLHRRNDTGEVFYVGKGSGNRATTRDNRNPHWHNVVNKAGFTAEIIAKGLTDAEAYWVEPLLIEAHGGVENLTNVHEGGHGFTSAEAIEYNKRRSHTPESREKLSKGQRKNSKCPHEWIPENIYTFPNGRRTCRTCFRNRVREWRHRQKSL